MTNDKPQTAEGKLQKFIWKVTINAPIETVWNTLVKQDEVLPFFFGAVCETKNGLKPGQKMRMVSKDRKNAIVYGEVKEFVPPTRYAHTMMFTQVQGEEPAFTAYDLKDMGNSVTEVTITTLVEPGTKHGKMVASGGYITENLKLVVETGRGNFMAAMIMAMGPLMSLTSPKICRIEKWPL